MQEKTNQPVSLKLARLAQKVIREKLIETPLIHYAGLSDQIGAEIYVKHENHQPTGSFKIRGGVNLMHHLSQQKVEGVITFSTGNHGLSIATAATWAGLPAVIVVPQNNNPVKNRLIRQTGAELIEAGTTFEEAAKTVEQLCEQRGLYYVHPANEAHLINGVGTEFLEIHERNPDIDAMIVPIGAGSEAAAAITVLKTLNPQIEIYAVQAEQSSAAWQSWKQGKIVNADNRTFAGGFATGIGYQQTFDIYRNQLTDFVLLNEEEIYQGIALAAYHTHNLVEGAGGASLMAAWKLRDQLKGRNVVVQFSGCNATPEELRRAYAMKAFNGH